MTRLSRAPKELVIVVCDPRKALFLQNSGTETHPRLEITQAINSEDPGRVSEDSDRAGRRFDGGIANRGYHAKSAMEANVAELEQAKVFANQVSTILAEYLDADANCQILLAGSPEFLGHLRNCLPDRIESRIVATVAKHLTNQPVQGIQAALFEPW